MKTYKLRNELMNSPFVIYYSENLTLNIFVHQSKFAKCPEK